MGKKGGGRCGEDLREFSHYRDDIRGLTDIPKLTLNELDSLDTDSSLVVVAGGSAQIASPTQSMNKCCVEDTGVYPVLIFVLSLLYHYQCLRQLF